MSTDADIRRGDVFWVDWTPARGSEQAGMRPALVVQRDAGNLSTNYGNTIVVAISSRGRDQFSHIEIEPDEVNGLPKLSYVKCEHILTVSKDRLRDRLGRLDQEQMRRVDDTIKKVLSLP